MIRLDLQEGSLALTQPSTRILQGSSSQDPLDGLDFRISVPQLQNVPSLVGEDDVSRVGSSSPSPTTPLFSASVSAVSNGQEEEPRGWFETAVNSLEAKARSKRKQSEEERAQLDEDGSNGKFQTLMIREITVLLPAARYTSSCFSSIPDARVHDLGKPKSRLVRGNRQDHRIERIKDLIENITAEEHSGLPEPRQIAGVLKRLAVGGVEEESSSSEDRMPRTKRLRQQSNKPIRDDAGYDRELQRVKNVDARRIGQRVRTDNILVVDSSKLTAIASLLRQGRYVLDVVFSMSRCILAAAESKTVSVERD